MNLLKWFKKSKVQSVSPSEQAIPHIVYPDHGEICTMLKSLQDHFNGKYVTFSVEVKQHAGCDAMLNYYLYVEDKCSDYFKSFEDLRLFVSNLS